MDREKLASELVKIARALVSDDWREWYLKGTEAEEKLPKRIGVWSSDKHKGGLVWASKKYPNFFINTSPSMVVLNMGDYTDISGYDILKRIEIKPKFTGDEKDVVMFTRTLKRLFSSIERIINQKHSVKVRSLSQAERRSYIKEMVSHFDGSVIGRWRGKRKEALSVSFTWRKMKEVDITITWNSNDLSFVEYKVIENLSGQRSKKGPYSEIMDRMHDELGTERAKIEVWDDNKVLFEYTGVFSDDVKSLEKKLERKISSTASKIIGHRMHERGPH